MQIDVLKLPSPCRSGRFCQTCRSAATGAAFRAQQQQAYPQMFGPEQSCNFGLAWEHTGAAPWADQFASMVRAQTQNAALDATAGASTFGPGDVVKVVLARLGYRVGPKCGCDEFRQKMNGWGWLGSWSHRTEIVDWFIAKAREQDIAVQRDTIWSLVRAGMKDLLRRRPRRRARRGGA
jgi:hypothetical protein